MKNYSKACQWDQQIKFVVNLNEAVLCPAFPWTTELFLCNVYIVLNHEDKDKFKVLLSSLSWVAIIVH